MGKQDKVAALIHLVKQSGIDVGQCCVVAEGVFFSDRRYAQLFAEKHGKDLKRVDGQVSG
jgi:hypothetical protein